MNKDQLAKVAAAMCAPGKGILAADESSGTIKKRFDAIGVESTADSRRDCPDCFPDASPSGAQAILPPAL